MTAPLTTLLELTAQIASAHCANNQVATDTLPALIHQIHQALVDAPTGGSSEVTWRKWSGPDVSLSADFP